jgi:hypothetical protein
MKEGYTHISIVLDRSGSMSSCLNDTIGGFNSFLNTQKTTDGEATISLIQFDDQYEILYQMSSLNESIELNNENYVPRGSTALLDAIGRTMNETEYVISEMDEDEKPEKVIFVIITDGFENASREFSRENIMNMIERHREENNWEVVFIGANQDAIQSGGSMGIRAGATLSYDQSALGTKTMYASLTRSMTDFRSKSVADTSSADFFSEEDREEQEELIEGKSPKGALYRMSVNTESDKGNE